jgi:ethanolamine utilization microcompartment shell protein EutL
MQLALCFRARGTSLVWARAGNPTKVVASSAVRAAETEVMLPLRFGIAA